MVGGGRRFVGGEGVEQRDRMIAAVAGEVAVLRSIMARLAPMKREKSKIETPARGAKVA